MKSISDARRSFIGLCAALLAFTSVGFAAGPAPERDQRRFEVNFLKNMIDHHYGAIKMSELCKGRTIHAELQEMCDMVITAQSAEIVKMQGWLKNWYGESETPSLTPKARRQVEQLSKLNGAEFEKAYMAILIGHHSMAVTMALDCLNEAYHPEMLNMCAMMMAAQGDEIMQLRLWLMQWYGINDLDHHDRTRADANQLRPINRDGVQNVDSFMTGFNRPINACSEDLRSATSSPRFPFSGPR